MKNEFSFREACAVAAIDMAYARVLIQRKTILIEEEGDKAPEKNGLGYSLSFATVLKLAILGRLLNMGFKPPRAWECAAVFTEVGDVTIQVGGEVLKASERGPGELYRDGITWLVIPSTGAAVVRKAAVDATMVEIVGNFVGPVICLDVNHLAISARREIEDMRQGARNSVGDKPAA